MKEQEIQIDGYRIKYKQKKRKYDSKHLLVVFSGFGGNGEFTYDMENVFQSINSDVIWIKDDFNNHCAYYLCINMDFSLNEAIYKFINLKLESLKLTKDECTLAGFSKGGTAALFYGLKFNFKNILSTVPQFHIGSYVREKWQKPAINMMGVYSDEQVNHLDKILPLTLENDLLTNKNIYLISSPADYQLEAEILPHVKKFSKYKNFNFLISHSKLVREHNQVTSHNIPIILSILYALTAGIPPKFGFAEIIGNQKNIDTPPDNPFPISIVRGIDFNESTLFIEGVGFIKGLSCENQESIYSELIIKNNLNNYICKLNNIRNPSITREFYDDGFINYDYGWFTNKNNLGINLLNIEPGIYSAHLRVIQNNNLYVSDISSEIDFNISPKSLPNNIKIYSSEDRKLMIEVK